MAPGLNGRQTGAVPKNKPRNSGAQSHRCIRDSPMQSCSLEWEPVLDQNSRPRSHRKISSTHSEIEADSIRYDQAGSLSSTMSSQIRLEDNPTEGNNQDIHGARLRVNMPDKKQVISKIIQIQDYIQQTASLMNALKSSDCPEKRNEYEKLSAILKDLKDSEAKLNEILKNLDSTESRKESVLSTSDDNEGDNNNNSDNNEEELIRRTEENKKKLELLQKREQELLELQDKARRQLQDAQMEQTRLVARASTLNQDINSNRFLDLNVQQLTQRLKTVQQLYKTSNQISETLADSRESNTEEPEHPDEDQVETSDTETDFQIVSDKVAELNLMRAQLAQIQKIMVNISLDPNAKDGMSTPAELIEDRRDLAAQQSRPARNDLADETNANAVKLEQAKLKLSQLTQLLEMAQSAQGSKTLPPGFIQIASNVMNEEGACARRSPSPSLSGKSQSKSGDQAYVETMQLMTRELEERTAAMKEEHEKLIAARQELENLARKIPLVKGERTSLSPDDSGSEAPCLTNIVLDSNGMFVNATATSEQPPPYHERSPYTCRGGHSKTRQRGVWNAYGSQERKCKNEEVSRSLQQIQNSGPRDPSRWSPSPTVSFCDNGSCSAVQAQAQNHLEKSGNVCGRIISEPLQRSGRPEEITFDEMYAQCQMLTRSVAQCSNLLWLHQKQIIELRNTFMLQQAVMFQNTLAFPNQPQRSSLVQPNPFQFGSMPNTFTGMSHPSPIPIQQLEQNYLSPNQGLKLNSSAVPNIQTPQDFTDPFYQPGPHNILPFSPPDVLDYQFRYGNCNRTNAQAVNSNLNVNQNLNQSGTSGLNNRVPVGGMGCLGPEDSGALNNQVPPGNRANNYWDNFRSYSRQNLLSHSKSNEGTDTARRTSTSLNQERPLREMSSSITMQNNSPAGPSHELVTLSTSYGAVDASDCDGCQSPSDHMTSHSRPNQVQVSRSRSAESQSRRKNESRNQENLNPKNDTRTRNPEGSTENIRSVRNDVNQSGNGRNFVQLVRDFDNDEGRSGINKNRMDKTRSRNEGRGNLNNRANSGLPVVLRDNVYSEVTNFIRANESRPHFLIQLFRDLQQITTDSLRQRTLESIQETVNVNNLTDRSNANGTNLNIIDNRNNMRENRSNLNRNQGEEQSIDSIVCQIRENQNTIRQNIAGNSALAGSGNNLENPNISNIRNLSNSRNNLENEGLRDLRTYFEANLCNFGHNSALENPNLSNIRENLTRRGTTGTDLDSANPKNLYLSMYDNVRRRIQDANSSTECFQRDEFLQNCSRGNNAECFCNNQAAPSSAGSRLDFRDGNFGENRQIPPPRYTIVDNKYVNNAREIGSTEGDSEADNNFNNESRKTLMACFDDSHSGKKNGSEEQCWEEAGAAALIPSEWDREVAEDGTYEPSVNSSRNGMPSCSGDCSGDCFGAGIKCTCYDLPQLDNGDLAEADQTRNEENPGVESNFTNLQEPKTENENCSAPTAQADEGSLGVLERRIEVPVGGESSLSDVREAESEGSCLYENSTSESEGTCMPHSESSECQLRRNMSL